jgi:hypothetical protein
MRLPGIICALFFTLTLLACSSAPGGVLVIPLNANTKHQGKNYAEWSVEWWRWALSQPAATHPLLDTAGQHALLGQTGTVYFLGTTFGSPSAVSRTISIPDGTSLFFPLFNFEQDSAFAPDTTVTNMVNEVANFAAQVTSLTLVVDGVAMPDLHMLRAKSPAPFSVQLPANDSLHSFFGIDAGTQIDTVVSDGYWAFIQALPVGTHTIQFGGTQVNAGEVTTITAHYNIIVLPVN